MRILFMGTPTFSVPILKALHQDYTVCAVVTQPDKPVGRKQILTPSPVKEAALALNLPVLQPRRIKDELETITALKPDVIITAAYGQILPKALLDYPKKGAINVHASLLPELRGGAPIQRAIERRYKTTGVTIMKMSQKMDAGAIYAQKAMTIDEDETSDTLFEKLSFIGKDLLLKVLPDILSNKLHAVPQNEELVTYAYNIKPEEELLDFNMPGEMLEAKIRAFYPTPNTYTYLESDKLKVIKADFHQTTTKSTIKNGTVVDITNQGIVVKTPTGYLTLKHVQLAGKKAMPVNDFMNGIGKTRVKVGIIFKKTA